MSIAASPDTPPPPQSNPVGLINAAPGSSTTTPGTTPPGNTGSGSPVTGYSPSQATSQNASAATYNPNAFQVAPNQTVASQLNNIIASGSPLMQQAETSAKNQMNQRGLINSSQAITAGQNAVISAATPIATADANTYAQAATNTTNAQNTALASGAQAQNAANLQNSQLGTQTNQFNAGQTNAALSTEAQASNTQAITAQQIAGSTNIQDIQSATQTAIQQSQVGLQTFLGEMQSSTTLTAQQISVQGQEVLANMNNASSQYIAAIQANTSLSIEQQQTLSAQVIASMNNTSAYQVQQLVNQGNLANIQANGQVNTQITNLTDQNKTLLQTSSGAAQLYNQALSNLSNIITNPNLSDDEKTTGLNDGVAQLQDGLNVMAQIAGIPGLGSTLSFNGGGGDTPLGLIT